MACWTRTGQHELIASFPNPATDSYTIDGIAVDGPWLVWVEDVGTNTRVDPHPIQLTSRSINVRSGRRGPVVSLPWRLPLLNAPLDGPLPSDWGGLNGPLTLTIVANNGWYAWASEDAETTNGPLTDALYVPDGKGGDIRVDVSAPFSGVPRSGHGISSLKVRGSTITWVIDGVRKQLRLGPRTPAALTPTGAIRARATRVRLSLLGISANYTRSPTAQTKPCLGSIPTVSSSPGKRLQPPAFSRFDRGNRSPLVIDQASSRTSANAITTPPVACSRVAPTRAPASAAAPLAAA